MWIVRELFRLLWAIVVTATIASAVAIVFALARSGDLTGDMRISFLGFGCFALLLAGAGNQTTGSNRRATLRLWQPEIFPGWVSSGGAPSGPALTESAVFVGCAVVLIVLGLAV